MHMTSINRLGGKTKLIRVWTPREDEAVRSQYPTMGAKALALQLKRTAAAVKLRAHELRMKARGAL